jgi:hypothetical protein
MKHLFVALSLVTAVSCYSAPTLANAYPDGGVAPPQCADQATKDKHPDWYRPGGFCSLNNGSSSWNGSTTLRGDGNTRYVP